jgi:hypothetical protein
VAEVIDEGRAPVAFIQDEVGRFQRWWPTLFEDSKTAEKRRTQDAPNMLRGLYSNAERLRFLFNALAPLSGQGRERIREFSASQIVLDSFRFFHDRIRELGVTQGIAADPSVPDIIGSPINL